MIRPLKHKYRYERGSKSGSGSRSGSGSWSNNMGWATSGIYSIACSYMFSWRYKARL